MAADATRMTVTWIAGGTAGKSFLLSVKSSTRRVADIMISFIGCPFCGNANMQSYATVWPLVIIYVALDTRTCAAVTESKCKPPPQSPHSLKGTKCNTRPNDSTETGLNTVVLRQTKLLFAILTLPQTHQEASLKQGTEPPAACLQRYNENRLQEWSC